MIHVSTYQSTASGRVITTSRNGFPRINVISAAYLRTANMTTWPECFSEDLRRQRGFEEYQDNQYQHIHDLRSVHHYDCCFIKIGSLFY